MTLPIAIPAISSAGSDQGARQATAIRQGAASDHPAVAAIDGPAGEPLTQSKAGHHCSRPERRVIVADVFGSLAAARLSIGEVGCLHACDPHLDAVGTPERAIAVVNLITSQTNGGGKSITRVSG